MRSAWFAGFIRSTAAVGLCAITITALAQAPLPQPQTQNAVTYLNGGAGDEEIGYIKQSMKDYDLALSFSRSGGEYVASVAVIVKDAHGATVIDLPSVGPYLLVKLPAGKYSVVANYHGDSKTRTGHGQRQHPAGRLVLVAMTSRCCVVFDAASTHRLLSRLDCTGADLIPHPCGFSLRAPGRDGVQARSLRPHKYG